MIIDTSKLSKYSVEELGHAIEVMQLESDRKGREEKELTEAAEKLKHYCDEQPFCWNCIFWTDNPSEFGSSLSSSCRFDTHPCDWKF